MQTNKLGTYSDDESALLSAVADYNGDGVIDAVDALRILSVYAENQTK